MGRTFEEILQQQGFESPSSLPHLFRDIPTQISRGEAASRRTSERLPFAERQGLVQTIFRAPLQLGTYLARFTPEARALKESELQTKALAERVRNSDLDTRRKQMLANVLDGAPTFDEVFPPRSAKQVIGDVIGTALFLVPASFGIRGATRAATLARGAATGAAFTGAAAASEDATTGDMFKAISFGAVVGAPLQLGGVLAARGVRKAARGVFEALSTRFPRVLTSIGAQLERDYGVPGQMISRRFQAASHNARQRAGRELDTLTRAGLLALDDAQALRLTDALEGRGPVTTEIKSAFDAVDSLRTRLAQEAVTKGIRVRRTSAKGPDVSELSEALIREAKAKGIKIKLDEPKDLPFTPRENYFPHFVPSVEKLNRGVLREKILQNTLRQGVFSTREKAEQVLNSYLDFTAKEGRSGGKFWVNWLVESGQAKTKEEATGKALRFFRRSRLQRFGPLERVREIDYPFYDPDPRSVIPTYLLGAVQRLEEVGTLGHKLNIIDTLIGKVRVADGADTAQAVAKLVNRVRGVVETSKAKEKWSAYARAFNIPKLAFAQIANIGQSLNTLLQSDVKSFAKGLAYAFTEEGKRRALQTGATLDSVLSQVRETAGGGGRFGEVFLKWTGFTAVEKANRTIAANVGFEYARSTFLKLQRKPTSELFKARLNELGINADRALARGTLMEEELQRAGLMLSEITQFHGRAIDLPAFVGSPEGRVIFQFKSFAFQQAKFLKNRLKFQVRHGNYGGLARDLLILGMVFPLTGEVIADVRSLATGSKRPTDALERYFSDLLAVGGFGIISDLIVSAHHGFLAESLLGPTGSTVTQGVERVVRGFGRRKIISGDIKFLLNQTGFGRAISNYVFPNDQKEQKTFLQTLTEVFEEYPP